MFPTHTHVLLLRSALFRDESALRAWQEWKSLVDLDQAIDAGTYRLLPLVYHNLRALDVRDSLMSKLKGIYRMEWTKNQILFRTGAEVLKSFHAAGIETLILKGAPLAVLYYEDVALRPMNDFDVLVPAAKRRQAIDLLLANGWQPEKHTLESTSDAYLNLRRGTGFINSHGKQLDLHWHIFSKVRKPDADLVFWQNALPVKFLDVSTRTICPTDQLLHACVHGAAWNPVPSVRWISDSIIILRKAGAQMDWNRLVEQAKIHRLVVPLRSALTYLDSTFQANIPPHVLTELNTIGVPSVEMELHRVLTSKPDWRGNLPMYWYKYLLDLDIDGIQPSLLHRLTGFVIYLQHTKGKTAPELLKWALSRTAVRLGRTLRGYDPATQ